MTTREKHDGCNELFSSDGGGEYFQWKAQAKQFEVDGEAAEVSEIAIDPASLKTGLASWREGSRQIGSGPLVQAGGSIAPPKTISRRS